VTINGNYALMQKQIADECSDNQQLLAPLDPDSGLKSPIQNAIQSAIAKWEREVFYFNDFRLEPTNASPFKTVIGQEFYGVADYALLGTLACIKSVRILESNNRYDVEERDSNYMNMVSVSPINTGLPTDWSYDAQQMRFYPIPNGVYPIGLTGTQRLSALNLDTDANAWTQDAYDLIRCEAKLILGRDVLHDDDMEAAARRAIYGTPGDPRDRGYLYDLKAETTRRHSSRSRIRPTNF
jgi:hypothetical protein